MRCFYPPHRLLLSLSRSLLLLSLGDSRVAQIPGKKVTNAVHLHTSYNTVNTDGSISVFRSPLSLSGGCVRTAHTLIFRPLSLFVCPTSSPPRRPTQHYTLLPPPLLHPYEPLSLSLAPRMYRRSREQHTHTHARCSSVDSLLHDDATAAITASLQGQRSQRSATKEETSSQAPTTSTTSPLSKATDYSLKP